MLGTSRAAVPAATTSPCSTSTGSSTSAARRSRAPRSTWRRPARRDATGVHHQQRRAPSGRVAAHLRELGVEAETDDVVTSAQAAAHVLRDRFGDGRAGRLPRRRRAQAGAAAAGLEPVGVEDDAVAIVTGYGPEVRWSDDHAGRGADPRRPALGGEQHRPDHPDGVRRRRPGTASRWRCCALQRGRARGGGQARSARCSTRRSAGSAASGR